MLIYANQAKQAMDLLKERKYYCTLSRWRESGPAQEKGQLHWRTKKFRVIFEWGHEICRVVLQALSGHSQGRSSLSMTTPCHGQVGFPCSNCQVTQSGDFSLGALLIVLKSITISWSCTLGMISSPLFFVSLTSFFPSFPFSPHCLQ